LQRQPSGALLRSQGSGQLQRQASGGLRTQGSGQHGTLRSQGSGAVAQSAPRRSTRGSIACAAAGDGLSGGDVAGAEQLRPQGSLPSQQPAHAGTHQQVHQHQLHEQQPEVADLDALMASSVEGIR
jgi:hypothetical protein